MTKDSGPPLLSKEGERVFGECSQSLDEKANNKVASAEAAETAACIVKCAGGGLRERGRGRERERERGRGREGEGERKPKFSFEIMLDE